MPPPPPLELVEPVVKHINTKTNRNMNLILQPPKYPEYYAMSECKDEVWFIEKPRSKDGMRTYPCIRIANNPDAPNQKIFIRARTFMEFLFKLGNLAGELFVSLWMEIDGKLVCIDDEDSDEGAAIEYGVAA